MVRHARSEPLSWQDVLQRVGDFEPLNEVDFTQFDPAAVAATAFSSRSLGSAIFDGMSLRYLNAEHAILISAQFRGADLEGGNFAGADLRGAVLTGAHISYADFTGAQLDGTCFASCIGAETAKLPGKLKKRAAWTDPNIRSVVLHRYCMIAAASISVSIPLSVAIWNFSPLRLMEQQLRQADTHVISVARQTAKLTAARNEAQAQLKATQDAIKREQQLLQSSRTAALSARSKDTPASGSLSPADRVDIAKGLYSLMFKTDTSVQEFVLYFQNLDWVERTYGSQARLDTVEELLALSKDEKPSLTELIRLSAVVRGVVSPAQIEKMLAEYFTAVRGNPSDPEAFWSFNCPDWRTYWIEHFKSAGML
jgi:uncharacterized protein YjbI with pentapeptide repeats